MSANILIHDARKNNERETLAVMANEAISKGAVVKYVVTTPTDPFEVGLVDLDEAVAVVVGVALDDIAAGDVGLICTRGVCFALVEGTTDVAAGDALVPSTALGSNISGVLETTGAAPAAGDGERIIALVAQAADSAVLAQVSIR